MKKIIGLTFAILALSACSPEEAFIGGTLAGIIVSDASDQRAQRQRLDRRSTDVFIESHHYNNYQRRQPRGHWQGNNYYPPLYAHPRRGYTNGNRYCYRQFSGHYRPRYC